MQLFIYHISEKSEVMLEINSRYKRTCKDSNMNVKDEAGRNNHRKKIYEKDWLETEHTIHSLPPCTWPLHGSWHIWSFEKAAFFLVYRTSHSSGFPPHPLLFSCLKHFSPLPTIKACTYLMRSLSSLLAHIFSKSRKHPFGLFLSHLSLTQSLAHTWHSTNMCWVTDFTRKSSDEGFILEIQSWLIIRKPINKRCT